jgi:hypothetical protein
MSESAVSWPPEEPVADSVTASPGAVLHVVEDEMVDPPFAASDSLGQDRIAGELTSLMRGWLGDIQPLSRHSHRKNAHVTRLSG